MAELVIITVYIPFLKLEATYTVCVSMCVPGDIGIIIGRTI